MANHFRKGYFCKQEVTYWMREIHGQHYIESVTHSMGLRIHAIAMHLTKRMGMDADIHTTTNGRNYIIYPEAVYEATCKTILAETKNRKWKQWPGMDKLLMA